MSSHISKDPECTCARDGVDIVDFECAAVWTHQDDGWVPVPNRSRQGGMPLALIGAHRPAALADYTATKGARRAAFLTDGEPIDTPNHPNRVPDYLVVWPYWDEFWAKREAAS